MPEPALRGVCCPPAGPGCSRPQPAQGLGTRILHKDRARGLCTRAVHEDAAQGLCTRAVHRDFARGPCTIAVRRSHAPRDEQEATGAMRCSLLGKAAEARRITPGTTALRDPSPARPGCPTLPCPVPRGHFPAPHHGCALPRWLHAAQGSAGALLPWAGLSVCLPRGVSPGGGCANTHPRHVEISLRHF